MEDQKIWDIIVKSLEQGTSIKERELLSDWVEESSEHRDILNEVSRVWELSGRKPLDFSDTNEAWSKLDNRILEDTSLEKNKDKKSQLFQQKNVTRIPIWMKVAAASCLLLIVAFLFLIDWSKDGDIGTSDSHILSMDSGNIPEIENPSETSETLETLKVITTLKSENKAADLYYLPDSTKVWLEQQAELSYDEDFSKENRTVNLKGEAFFEVKRDANSEFIINTNLTETKVLGTSFNLKGSTNGNVELKVMTGKVLFSSKRKEGERLILQKGDRGLYNYKSGKLVKKAYGKSGLVAWKKNNPKHSYEVARPVKNLILSTKWEKNFINQSILQGEITNNATFATYKDIKLKYTVENYKGVKKEPHYFKVFDSVGPNKTIVFKYKLLDIFTKTDNIKVEIVGAKR